MNVDRQHLDRAVTRLTDWIDDPLTTVELLTMREILSVLKALIIVVLTLYARSEQS